jgi:hypothetical protein
MKLMFSSCHCIEGQEGGTLRYLYCRSSMLPNTQLQGKDKIVSVSNKLNSTP